MANEDAANQPQQDTTEQSSPADLIPLGTTGDVIPARVLETLTGGAGSDVVATGSGKAEIDEPLNLETLSVYMSHKQVHAAVILEVRQDVQRLVIDTPAGPDIVDVPENFFARAVPAEGDFFVRYRDGYVSFCPKSEFIDGYRLVESGTDGDMVTSAIGERPAGLLSDEGLSRAIAATPAERVTEEYIRSRIVGTDYITVPNTTVTICHITLDNGYSVRGESACVNPANFRQDIGERIAHDDAFRKLWPLFGFLLAEANHRRGHGVPAVPVDLIARTAFEAAQTANGRDEMWSDLAGVDRATVMAHVDKLLADPTGEGEDATFRAVVRGLTA